MSEVPGPFYTENGYLYRRSHHPNHVDTWCHLGDMNATEAAVLVRVLNKGTHYDALVKTLDLVAEGMALLDRGVSVDLAPLAKITRDTLKAVTGKGVNG